MKRILKDTRWLTVIAIVALFVTIGCDKSETPPVTCNIDNPLTDLPWLKEIVDGFEKDAVAFGYNQHARIYQCAYKDGIGFLLEMCVECPDAGYSFRNCEGVVLCSEGGLPGKDNCSELNINYENKKLIWEKEENVQQPCYCIMDTLKGEWSWYKTYTAKGGLIDNEYKSIIKIFNQNEDATINYEVFVDNTLFYKGNFQFQYDQWRNGITNIKLPHYNIINNNWLILFKDIEGKPSKDILCFFSGADDDNKYFYQKIK